MVRKTTTTTTASTGLFKGRRLFSEAEQWSPQECVQASRRRSDIFLDSTFPFPIYLNRTLHRVFLLDLTFQQRLSFGHTLKTP
jgi:hypothetical protein